MHCRPGGQWKPGARTGLAINARGTCSVTQGRTLRLRGSVPPNPALEATGVANAIKALWRIARLEGPFCWTAAVGDR